jgi:hypothetical protein
MHARRCSCKDLLQSAVTASSRDAPLPHVTVLNEVPTHVEHSVRRPLGVPAGGSLYAGVPGENLTHRDAAKAVSRSDPRFALELVLSDRLLQPSAIDAN